MRMRGVEPPRAKAHRHLKPARLPIPPHPRQRADTKHFADSSQAFTYKVGLKVIFRTNINLRHDHWSFLT
jgi:hypothetical protein